eukprot:scaffold20887_cov43-Phaeocystis_antarctica.AAC.1
MVSASTVRASIVRASIVSRCRPRLGGGARVAPRGSSPPPRRAAAGARHALSRSGARQAPAQRLVEEQSMWVCASSIASAASVASAASAASSRQRTTSETKTTCGRASCTCRHLDGTRVSSSAATAPTAPRPAPMPARP